MTDYTPHAHEAEAVKRGRSGPKAAGREKTQAQFLELLSKGVTVSGAARAAGIARKTVYLWRDGDEAFAAQWDEHVKIGVECVEDIVRQHAAKDWRAAEAWLRAHARNKWGQHVKTDQTVRMSNLDDLLDELDGQGRDITTAQAKANTESGER